MGKKYSRERYQFKNIFLSSSLIIILVGFFLLASPLITTAQSYIQENGQTTFLPLIIQQVASPGSGEYVVIGWNDLGMHCYNPDFQDLAVLPPYNTLWAQVVRRGDPPEIITSDLKVTYNFPNNTYSMGKSNFWEYDLQLFGVDLPANVGLTGKGLAGEMDAHGDHFIAEGIPLTEYNDGDHQTRVPYQLANITVYDADNNVLASNQVVAPVSTEMRCDICHHDGAFEISTGRVETNILTLHDYEHLEKYPPGHEMALMDRRPFLCAECHASNALNAPGIQEIPNLSHAIHEKHDEVIPDTTEGCYNCHPGPETKCLRDVMSNKYEMGCTDCHGGMYEVAENPNPWLNEPRCDDCHTESRYAQDNPLYRLSKGHGGLYCEACHDSTHAIATSSQPEDSIKFSTCKDMQVRLRNALYVILPTREALHHIKSKHKFGLQRETKNLQP